MDQVHETNDPKDLRDLLLEVLKMQEMLLHRIERLEDSVTKLHKKP